MSHPVTCTIDLSAEGTQVGEIRLPSGTSDGAFVAIPVATIANGTAKRTSERRKPSFIQNGTAR